MKPLSWKAMLDDGRPRQSIRSTRDPSRWRADCEISLRHSRATNIPASRVDEESQGPSGFLWVYPISFGIGYFLGIPNIFRVGFSTGSPKIFRGFNGFTQNIPNIFRVFVGLTQRIPNSFWVFIGFTQIPKTSSDLHQLLDGGGKADGG